MRKGEIACYKQFLLFSQCFLSFMALNFHLECTLKFCLQYVSNLDKSKILSCSNRLMVLPKQDPKMTKTDNVDPNSQLYYDEKEMLST